MTTYRERREAKAAKLREWADGRRAKADAIEKADAQTRADFRFVAAQPGIGRHPSVRRLLAREDREYEHRNKAGAMAGRAIGIEQQLEAAIYDDDPDAVERLKERIAGLEAKRDGYKARNAEYRAAHKDELKGMTVWQKDQVLPAASYQLTNLGADIRRNQKRLEDLKKRAAPDAPRRYRLLTVKYAGKCETCGGAIERGADAFYEKAERALYCGRGCLV